MTLTLTRPITGTLEDRDRPAAGSWEHRTQAVTVDGRRLRSRIPYGVESRDLGGFTEIIEPGALRNARLDDLVATVNHSGLPIGRHPSTLELEDRADGLHWSVDPPASRQDVIEAVTRGDLQGASWRMRVARDHWQGDIRHVDEIAELRDVSIVTHPAYAGTEVELRDRESGRMSAPAPRQDSGTGNGQTGGSGPSGGSQGRLRVEGRTGGEGSRSLAECFRSAGFPGERAEIPFNDFEARAVTWSAPVDQLNQTRRTGAGLGSDQRFAWPAFGRISVDAGTTSVAVVQQSGRTLADPEDVIRDIDATTPKPETSSTLDIATLPLRGVAAVQSGVPNVYLAQRAIDTIIEQDLRLTINHGLDQLVIDALGTVTQTVTPAGPLIASVRKAITLLDDQGYSADTLILDPASAEALDLMKATAADDFYLFAPDAAPRVWDLNRRISKTIPAPVVADTGAFGKLYSSAVSLARFEENAGSTNTSKVRLELNAAFGVERLAAAVRIAANAQE